MVNINSENLNVKLLTIFLNSSFRLIAIPHMMRSTNSSLLYPKLGVSTVFGDIIHQQCYRKHDKGSNPSGN
jgi:hypothetical protein